MQSFRGHVNVPLASHACTGHGHLTCIVGPNGSGKSTLADALVFCFGERDFRAKGLVAIVNEEAWAAFSKEGPESGDEDAVNVEDEGPSLKGPVLGKGRRVAASVAVDLRVTSGQAQSILRVSRTILLGTASGKASSEYRLETLPCDEFEEGAMSRTLKVGDGVAAPTIMDDEAGNGMSEAGSHESMMAAPFKLHNSLASGLCVTRAGLAEKLLPLGINLKVVDSFVCTQQGSSFTKLSGTELLAVIEALVGTAPLAKEIETLQGDYEEALDTAVRLEGDEARVRDLRRALAPARASFEAYRGTQASFFADLRAFAIQERALYTLQRAENNDRATDTAALLEAAKEAAQPAEDDLAAAQAVEKAAGKAVAKARARERVKARSVADAEEDLGQAQAQSRAAARKLAASMKRHPTMQSELSASRKARADAAAASDAAVHIATQGETALASAEAALAAMFLSSGGSSRGLGADAKTINALRKLSAKLRDARGALANAEAVLEVAIQARDGAAASARTADGKAAAAKDACTAAEAWASAAAAEVTTAGTAFSAIFETSARASSTLVDTEARAQQLQQRLLHLKADHKATGRVGSLRKSVVSLIARLAASPVALFGSGCGGAVVVHGWLDELAFCHDGFGTCLNAVLGGALGSVLVVGSRCDAVALVEAAKASGVGPISCDILDELTASSSSSTHQHGDSTPRKLMEGIDLVDAQFRPVFESRLKNWIVCDDDDAALAATKPIPTGNGSRAAVASAVTWSGNLFLNDGELRISAPQPRSDRRAGGFAAQRNGDLRLRGQGSATAASSTKAAVPDELLEVETDFRATQAELVQVAAAARDADNARLKAVQAKREIDSRAHDTAAGALGAAEALRTVQREATSAQLKLTTVDGSLHSAESASANARAAVEHAQAELNASYSGTTIDRKTNWGSWLAAEAEASTAATAAKAVAAAARASERAAANALKAADRALLRVETKNTSFEAIRVQQEDAKKSSDEKTASARAALEAKQKELATASEALQQLLRDHEVAQASSVAAQAASGNARARLDAALSGAQAAAKQGAELDAWDATMSQRDAQLEEASPLPAPPESKSRDRAQAVDDSSRLYVDLSDSGDDFEEVSATTTTTTTTTTITATTGASNHMPDEDDDFEDEDDDGDEDKAPLLLFSKMQKRMSSRRPSSSSSNGKRKQPEKSAPWTPSTTSKKKLASSHRARGLDALKEELAVARAGLRLRQDALQKAEDCVDVTALEKDLVLAVEEKALNGDADNQRRRATIILERKGRLELERFTKLFG